MRLGLLIVNSVIFLFFFLFFPSWIIQAVALLFMLTFLFSFLYSHLLRSRIVVRRKDTVLRGYRQQKLSMELVVENRGPIPVHHLLVRDMTGALTSEESATFFFRLRPGERRKLTYRVESAQRGEFEVGPALIAGADPLGFFPWKISLKQSTRIIVYPRVYPLRLSDKEGLPAGNIRTENRIYEDVTRYRSLREYMSGDDPRRISWKVSARLGKLFCMEFLPALYFPVLILLNLTSSDYPLKYRQHRAERAIEAAASLIYYFIGIKQEVGLASSGRLANEGEGRAVPIKSGYGHAVTLLEYLARINLGSFDFSELLMSSGIRIPLGTRLILVSPPLRKEQFSFLDDLRRRGYRVELFQITRAPAVKDQDRNRRFTSHYIQDYGDELI